MQRLLIVYFLFLFSFILESSFAQNTTSTTLPLTPIKQASSRTQQFSLLIGAGYIPNLNHFFTSSFEYTLPHLNPNIEKQKENLLTQLNWNMAYNRYLIGNQQAKFNLFATFQLSTNKFGQTQTTNEREVISYSFKNFIPMNLSLGMGTMFNTKYVSWFAQLQTAQLNRIPSTLEDKYRFPISLSLGAMLPLPKFKNQINQVNN